MAEGREDIDFHQSNHEFGLLTLHTRGQRPLLSKMPTWQYFLTKVTDSQRKFGSYMNGDPNYG